MIIRPRAVDLRPYRGLWIGVHQGKPVVCGEDVLQVVDYIREHEVEVDMVFRVPMDPTIDEHK